MRIHGFNKTTLLDYPGIVAATIFTGACNFRCPFCQNAGLVLDPENEPIISEDEVLAHLKKRKGITKGVCISGGEPTLQKDLKEFIYRLKELELLVKLDTNGYRPEAIEDLFKEGLLDYVAMDIKSSLNGYSKVSGIDIDANLIERSIELIMNSKVPYEFRTTVVRELHDKADFIEIGKMIKGADKYFLQGFVDSEMVIQKGLSGYSREELEELVDILKPEVKYVAIRGVD